jgi:hypothetical protein
VLWGTLGCEDPGTGLVGVVRRVEISIPTSTLRPGRVLTALARPLDADGELVPIPVLWRSLTPSLIEVDSTGEVRALAPGTGIIEAVAGGVTGRREIPLVNPAATQIRVPADTLRLTIPGLTTIAAALASDADGEQVVGAQFAWSSEAPRIATVTSGGVVAPVAVGITTLTVMLDGVREVRTVRVSALESATAPLVSEITGAPLQPLQPGVPFTVRGSRFATTTSGNTVLVDGLPATVTAATGTQLTAVLSASGVPCLPTRDVAVQVTTTGGIGAGVARLQVAPQRELAVGEALILTSASAAACNEFVEGAGRYLVTVQNGGRALGAGSISLALDGRAGVGAVVAIAAPAPAVQGAALRQSDPHLRILEASAEAVRRAHAAPQLRRSPSLQVPPVNGIAQVRVPDLTSANLCNSFTTIGARTVYEGRNVAILEDTLSQRGGVPTLAGTMDAMYAAIGAEFDDVAWPIAQRFGDPLVMDSRLDANGRVVLVATPRLNEMFGGQLLGAVVTCDLYFRTQFASSNVGEVIYLAVPTSPAAGMAPGTRERWRYEIRGTIAHELKHVVSFAGRVVRNQPLEESWLEEATARHAEEFFARSRLGFSGTGDVGFGVLDCEARVLEGAPDCAGTPRTLLPHFEGLWDFLSASTTRSPLGPTAAGDFSFYGSGWSLTRWALDHAAQAEDALLAQLTSSGQSGIANLEGRIGRSWDDILGRWTLAQVAEARGVTASDATLRFPSWNFENVYARLCTDLGRCGAVPDAVRFTRPYPLQTMVLNEAAFTVTVPEIVPGGFRALEIGRGAAGTRRLLRLRDANSPFLPPTARIAILRVE